MILPEGITHSSSPADEHGDEVLQYSSFKENTEDGEDHDASWLGCGVIWWGRCRCAFCYLFLQGDWPCWQLQVSRNNRRPKATRLSRPMQMTVSAR